MPQGDYYQYLENCSLKNTPKSTPKKALLGLFQSTRAWFTKCGQVPMESGARTHCSSAHPLIPDCLGIEGQRTIP